MWTQAGVTVPCTLTWWHLFWVWPSTYRNIYLCTALLSPLPLTTPPWYIADQQLLFYRHLYLPFLIPQMCLMYYTSTQPIQSLQTLSKSWNSISVHKFTTERSEKPLYTLLSPSPPHLRLTPSPNCTNTKHLGYLCWWIYKPQVLLIYDLKIIRVTFKYFRLASL